MNNAENHIADVTEYMQAVGERARAASRLINRASTAQKNAALLAIADSLNIRRDQLIVANQKDLDAGRGKNLDAALMDRLELTPQRIDAMIDGLRQVAGLEDPVGAVTDLKYRPSGIQVGKMRVPLGVIGIIYESRPNVTCEAASLCLKAGNAAILRGGSEALLSNQAIAACVREGLAAAGLDVNVIQVIDRPDRDRWVS